MYKDNIITQQKCFVGVCTIMVVQVQAKGNLYVLWNTSELEYN